MRVAQRVSISNKPVQGAGFRLRAVRLLAMPEPDFARLIRQAEDHPLFERVRRFVRRTPYRGAGFHVPLDENTQRSAGRTSSIPWSDHERELELIRRIGQEAFEKHFLRDEDCLSLDETARRCRITTAEAAAIRDLLFLLSLGSNTQSSLDAGPPALFASCVAKVTCDRGEIELGWTLPHLARGRYRLDYEGLQEFQKAALTAPERKELRALLGLLEGINIRQDTLDRLLRLLLEKQGRFMRSGREEDLQPLSGRAVASSLNVHPSTVSRSMACRSVILPSGREWPLRRLSPSRRQVMVGTIRGMLSSIPEPVSDACVARHLARSHGIAVSRRTVNEWRRDAEAAHA